MTELELSAGEYEAGVAPALGGALTFLRQSGRDLLRPAASLDAIREDPRSAASFVCVPYFGRLYGGLDFAGRHWDMAPTVPACDPKSALHGEGWISPWTLEDGSHESVTLRLVHDGQAKGRFPFAYIAEQHIALSETGLSIVLTVTNAGDPRYCRAGPPPLFSAHARDASRFLRQRLLDAPARERAGPGRPDSSSARLFEWRRPSRNPSRSQLFGVWRNRSD
ncbi:MAG: hypothetical protein R3C55_03345 [Parvularculaceae bacterium]